MRVSAVFSFTLACGVLVAGLRMASKDLSIFIDYPSLFIVLGGTFASSSMSFDFKKLFTLMAVAFKRMIFGKTDVEHSMVLNLVKISKDLQAGKSHLDVANSQTNFFLKEAMALISDKILSHQEIIEILHKRNNILHMKNLEDAQKVKTVGKFAPAFGMIGTTIGMIVLLANLGGKDAMKMIGPAMGVCLITTLYGSVFANMTFIPIAENLSLSGQETKNLNKIIIRGVDLILQEKSPVFVAEDLNSHLRPGDRVDWKSAVGG